MGRYRILIKPSAVRELEAISGKQDRQLIVRRIGRLADEPRPPGCQKLSGRELYRLRQGSYRVIYEIRDSDLILNVVKIGDRKEIYRAR